MRKPYKYIIDEKLLPELVKTAKSYLDLLISYNIEINPYPVVAQRKLRKLVKKLKLDITHFDQGKALKQKIKKEQTHKKCTKCGKVLDIASFTKKGEYKSSMCRQCSSLWSKEWYKKNKEKRKAAIKKNKNKLKSTRRKWLNEIKSAPCTDCNKKYPPVVMDFDHIKDKKFNISTILYIKSKDTLLKEIEKCELVCSNCHRVRTENRRIHPTL